MIDANELMIGNLLHYTTAEGHIMEVSIKCDSIHWASTDPKGFNATHSPIPLTPEILERCGFVKVVDNKDSGFKTFEKRIAPNFIIDIYIDLNLPIDVQLNKSIILSAPCDHLHQLQNLVFILTGKQLVIRL